MERVRENIPFPAASVVKGSEVYIVGLKYPLTSVGGIYLAVILNNTLN